MKVRYENPRVGRGKQREDNFGVKMKDIQDKYQETSYWLSCFIYAALEAKKSSCIDNEHHRNVKIEKGTSNYPN